MYFGMATSFVYYGAGMIACPTWLFKQKSIQPIRPIERQPGDPVFPGFQQVRQVNLCLGSRRAADRP
jgi:hypothetical protein